MPSAETYTVNAPVHVCRAQAAFRIRHEKADVTRTYEMLGVVLVRHYAAAA